MRRAPQRSAPSAPVPIDGTGASGCALVARRKDYRPERAAPAKMIGNSQLDLCLPSAVVIDFMRVDDAMCSLPRKCHPAHRWSEQGSRVRVGRRLSI